MIGCECKTCRSDDPRDRRLRPSLFIRADDGGAILIDAGPDLRVQALTFDITRVDAIVFTHGHADHILGLDDVRRYNHIMKRPMACYADAQTVFDIRRMFAYVFDPDAPKGGGLPQLALFTLEGPFSLGRQEITPIPVLHGQRTIFGFRLGDFAYVTDCSAVPDRSWPLLSGLKILVLDALRERPHPTHFSLTEAVDVARQVGAARTYFTHMCHDLRHADTNAKLPSGIELAYDGLRLCC